jgi:hypothetical protein
MYAGGSGNALQDKRDTLADVTKGEPVQIIYGSENTLYGKRNTFVDVT